MQNDKRAGWLASARYDYSLKQELHVSGSKRIEAMTFTATGTARHALPHTEFIISPCSANRRAAAIIVRNWRLARYSNLRRLGTSLRLDELSGYARAREIHSIIKISNVAEDSLLIT